MFHIGVNINVVSFSLKFNDIVLSLFFRKYHTVSSWSLLTVAMRSRPHWILVMSLQGVVLLALVEHLLLREGAAPPAVAEVPPSPRSLAGGRLWAPHTLPISWMDGWGRASIGPSFPSLLIL